MSVEGPFVDDAGFSSVDDRGVNGVLEQIRIHNCNVPDHPGRYAEVDTDYFAFRVCPHADAAIAEMPKSG